MNGTMSLLDEVKQRANIAQIVSEYVDLDPSSRTPKALCPFHSERTPSFVVYPEAGNWHCFGSCSTGGDVVSFLMKQENLPFGEALRQLAQRYGIDSSSRETVKRPNSSAFQANEVAARYFRDVLNGPDGKDARAYLESRRISRDLFNRRGIGLAPVGMETLGGHLRNKGVSAQDAVEAGLLTRSRAGEWRDMFRGRVTFEIHDSQGRTVGFGARSLDGTEPKYLNTQATAMFDKSASLYGLDWAADSIRKSASAVVVEGYVDVITAHEHGFKNVVACMGTAVTAAQLEILSKLLARPPQGTTARVTLCLDSDAAGEEATLRNLEDAWRGSAGSGPNNGAALYVARSETGKDPDEAIRADPEAWRTSIAQAQPLLEYLMTAYAARHDLSTGDGKGRLVEELRPIILTVGNAFEQDRYLTRLAEIISVSSERLRSMMRGARQHGTYGRPQHRPRNARTQPEERLDPSQIGKALEASSENGLEEHLLSLVLSNEDLRDYATAMPEEHFLDSGNRTIFTTWRTSHTLTGFAASADDQLAGRIERLKSKPLPPCDHLTKVQDVSQTVRRLHERYLRRLKQLQKEAFAQMGPGAPADELLKMRQRAAATDSDLKLVFPRRS